MSWTNVSNVLVTATGTVVDQPCRVRAFTITNLAATGGVEVAMADVSAGVSVTRVREIVAGVSGTWPHLLPAAGVRFQHKLKVIVPTSVVASIYFDGV